jgi:HlyD family secretion protein
MVSEEIPGEDNPRGAPEPWHARIARYLKGEFESEPGAAPEHWSLEREPEPQVPAPARQWFGRSAAHEDEFAKFLDPRRLVNATTIGVIVSVIGFAGWAAVAPLDSAIIAPGVVIVETRSKTVQHLEGGIVRDVLVAEGDQVSAGQVLFRLDDTQRRATVGVLQSELDALAAQEARLIAERDGLDAIEFPPGLVARSSLLKVSEAIRGETGAFRNRRDMLNKQIEILYNRKLEDQRLIDGLKAQQAALETQLDLVKTESDMIGSLVDKGIEPLPRLLAIQRAEADLKGQHGQIIEKIAQVRVNGAEAELQIVNLRNQILSDVLNKLRDAQTQRFAIEDRLDGARDVLDRLAITAPVDGRVKGLKVHTNGAVIQPGEPLLDIVPDKDELDIEVQVRPEDIDEVRSGSRATVTLTAYKQRNFPVATGTVSSVSADRFINQQTGQSFFTARVHVDPAAWKDYPEIHLLPGMPVEVALETGSRTALEYSLAPVQAVLRRGMREK